MNAIAQFANAEQANSNSSANALKESTSGQSFLDTLMNMAGSGLKSVTDLAETGFNLKSPIDCHDKKAGAGTKKNAKNNDDQQDSPLTASKQDQTLTPQVTVQEQTPAVAQDNMTLPAVTDVTTASVPAPDAQILNLSQMDPGSFLNGGLSAQLLAQAATDVEQGVASAVTNAAQQAQSIIGSEASAAQGVLKQVLGAIQSNLGLNTEAAQPAQNAPEVIVPLDVQSSASTAVALPTESKPVEQPQAAQVNDLTRATATEQIVAQLAAINVQQTQSENAAATAKTEVGKVQQNMEDGAVDPSVAVHAVESKPQAQSGVDARQAQSQSSDEHQSGSAKQDRAHADKIATVASTSDATPVLSSSLPVHINATQSNASSFKEVSAQVTAQPAETGNAPQVAEANTQVNAARLIQSASQAEMRVGMTSSEFGNISISTSSTRDTVLAQISVDHTELAKTLTAQLSDFHARQTSQPMEVRIDMHGTSMNFGQGTDSQAGNANGSANQSNSGRQQQSASVHSYSSSAAEQRPVAAMVAAQASANLTLSGRLDITA